MPHQPFIEEVEKYLTGESEASEPIYFKVYKSQMLVIEQALDTAALMLGSDKSRGYCPEMICAYFLAEANVENGNPGKHPFSSESTESGGPRFKLITIQIMRNCSYPSVHLMVQSEIGRSGASERAAFYATGKAPEAIGRKGTNDGPEKSTFRQHVCIRRRNLVSSV